MSELRINWMALRNFAGIQQYHFEPAGGDADIFAANGLGKTTLANAFQWLIDGKNAAHEAKFSVKTLDANGEATHGLEHEVEASLLIDGTEITLRRVYHEVYTKRRGGPRKEFSGNTTDYFVNNVPATESEYKAAVAAIADEATFRLLSDIYAFNSEKVMKWSERRQLLLEVCGDVTDADVIASNPKLAELPEIQGDKTIDQLKAVIGASRKKINEQLEQIPARIDEAQRAIPETNQSPEDIEHELRKLREAAQKKHEERAQLKAGGQAAELTKQLREAEGDLLVIERDIRTQAGTGADEVEQERRLWKNRIEEADRLISSREQDIRQNDITKASIEKTMEGSREAWHQINDREFTPEELSDCPICGAAPEHQSKHDPEKALAAFNRQKAADLEANVETGMELKTSAGDLALRNEQLRKEIAEAEESKAEIQQTLDALPEPTTATEPVFEDDPDWQAKSEQIASLSAQVARLTDSNADALTEIDNEIQIIKLDIQTLTAAEAQIEQAAKGKGRIEELKTQEKDLAAQFEELERQLRLCEIFITTKVSMLTDKINGRFELARFRLFEEQVNGGIKECCETTVSGVPYSDLNTGARIRVGMDIIKTLSEHFGFVAPVWVDNSESLTDPITAPGQLIRLIASEADDKLRIETKEKING